jgi:hypothetical protein
MKLTIILREISQTHKDKYHVFSHMWSLNFFLRLESRRGTISEEIGQVGGGRGKINGDERVTIINCIVCKHERFMKLIL